MKTTLLRSKVVLRFCHMKRNAIILTLVSSFALASAVVYSATELARVNGTLITLEDFNKKYRENLKFFQFKTPTREGVLDDLVKRELGIQEAKKLGLDKDPEIVDRMYTVLYHSLLEWPVEAVCLINELL